MKAPVNDPLARPLKVSALGTAASIPWCCVAPAALAAAGTASSVPTPWVGATVPVFLALSAALFARAHYLLWMRRHGSPAARLVTVALTVLSAGVWAFRLSPAVAALVLG
jgi:hypothetical protein